jgi:catechol 2,3-dioxygenase-like lactoylglutathione lyase family enzyme
MEPRVNFITLGVDDVAAGRRFYVDGLRWTPVFEEPGEVCFFQVGPGLLLVLWKRASLAEDMHAELGTGRPPAALAHNVGSDAAVVEIVERARAAGATVLKEPALTPIFGGFQAYIEDPCGFVWEIAHNPGWSVDPDGTVHLGPS